MQQSPSSANFSSLRRANIASLLRALWRDAPLTRPELAKRAGLDKSTISRLIEELVARGIVQETGYQPSTGGRPSVCLEINQRFGCVIGAEITAERLRARLMDLRAQTLLTLCEEHGVFPPPESTISRLQALIESLLRQAPPDASQLLGIGIAVPGMVNDNGEILYAANLRWENICLRQKMASHFPFPVFIENEANAAGLAEVYFGQGQDADNVLYLSMGRGLGGCLLIDRRIYRGTGGFAGKVGHSTLFPNGNLCNCGNRGCLEAHVNPKIVTDRVRQALRTATADNPTLRSRIEASGDDALEAVVEAAKENDPICQQVLAEVGGDLGIAVANLINILSPELIVFGGRLSLAGEFILPAVQATIEQRALRQPRALTRLALSSLGADAALKGAAALVVEEMLANPPVC